MKGFSFVELLVAVVISLLIVGGAIAIYLTCLTSWKEDSIQAFLQRQASITLEQMVRGISGNDGIREASSVNIPNSSTIEYTSGIDSVTRSFYLVESAQIIYDPNISVSSDEYSIVDNVRTGPEGVTFSENGGIVTINLGLGKQVLDKTISVDLTTQIKLRN